MTVRLEAFLALEASLSSRIMQAWGKVADAALPLIYSKLQRNDILGATQVVDDLDLAPVVQQTRDYVRYVSLASILYGASRFSAPADTKIMDKGTHYLSPLIARTTASFAAALTNSVGDMVRDGLYDAIAAHDVSLAYTNFAPSDDRDIVVKAEAVHEYLRPFVEFRNPIQDMAQRMLQMISSLHTSRLAAFGYTEEAQLLGYTQYAITEQLDNKICEVCTIMHGKVFEVADARALLERVLLTDDPTELKTLQPWPKQNKAALQELRGMSDEEIVDRGWHIPPYHPWCRGQLVPIDQVPRIEDTASYQAAFPTEGMGDFSPANVTVEDFQNLGIDVTPEQMELWNREVNDYPSNFMSMATGMSPQDMSDLAYDPVKDNYDSLRYGVAVVLTVAEEERLTALMHMAGRFFGIEGVEAKLEYTIEEARALLRLSELGVAEEEEAQFPTLMGAWVGSALLLGMELVEMDATDDPSGRMFTDYGATPSFDEWSRIRKEVEANLESGSGSLEVTAAEREEILVAIDTDDPKQFWDLIALDNAEVNKLLASMNLKVNLFLDDIATMERFSEATKID